MVAAKLGLTADSLSKATSSFSNWFSSSKSSINWKKKVKSIHCNKDLFRNYFMTLKNRKFPFNSSLPRLSLLVQQSHYEVRPHSVTRFHHPRLRPTKNRRKHGNKEYFDILTNHLSSSWCSLEDSSHLCSKYTAITSLDSVSRRSPLVWSTEWQLLPLSYRHP